jgi:hypothetical protein
MAGQGGPSYSAHFTPKAVLRAIPTVKRWHAPLDSVATVPTFPGPVWTQKLGISALPTDKAPVVWRAANRRSPECRDIYRDTCRDTFCPKSPCHCLLRHCKSVPTRLSHCGFADSPGRGVPRAWPGLAEVGTGTPNAEAGGVDGEVAGVPRAVPGATHGSSGIQWGWRVSATPNTNRSLLRHHA